MAEPLFRKLDCLMLKAADLDAGIAFYTDALGHRVIWRSPVAAGLAMPDTDAELVLHTQLGPEANLLVADVDEAFDRFLAAGGREIRQPFDIPIGRCAVVMDPQGNVLVMLDQSKGKLDANGQLIVTAP
ncbi:VOC family protein [Phenylobacterium sp.]|uniref:VOC family protein n=1 Tax=Phenylobacterium sp. TaxID=1871053 RepID=UPI003BAAA656